MTIEQLFTELVIKNVEHKFTLLNQFTIHHENADRYIRRSGGQWRYNTIHSWHPTPLEAFRHRFDFDKPL